MCVCVCVNKNKTNILYFNSVLCYVLLHYISLYYNNVLLEGHNLPI